MVLYKKDDAGTAFDGQSWEIKFLHESTKRKNVSALIQDQAAEFLNFFQIFFGFPEFIFDYMKWEIKFLHESSKRKMYRL